MDEDIVFETFSKNAFYLYDFTQDLRFSPSRM